MTTDQDNEVGLEAMAAAMEVGGEIGRFLGRTHVSIRHVEDAMRMQFIASHMEQLKTSGVPVTVPRLALATGLPKSVVEQALAQLDEAPRKRSAPNVNEDGFFAGLDLLLSLWSTDSRFTAVYGVPRDLRVRKVSGEENTLEDLAEIALPGVPFERVLNELREKGLIALSDQRLTAKLTGHTAVVGNRERRAVARYGRLVAGLMRTLRANYDGDVLAGTAKPWELTLNSDRPIARQHISTWVELVEQKARSWFENLEIEQQTLGRGAADHVGSRFGVCCFVSEDAPKESASRDFRGAFVAAKPFIHAMVTSNRLDADAYLRFRSAASASCDAWFLSVDSEQKLLFAEPNQDGVVMKVTCFLFPITGTEGRADEVHELDLVEAAARARRSFEWPSRAER